MKYSRNPVPTFTVFKDSPRDPINGVGRLPAALTINSITEYPVLRYTAGGGMVDVNDWRPWGYGENLDRVVVATAPTINSGSPGLGVLDDSVLFNASGDYFRAGNNTFADITTEDFVIEVVLKFSTTNLSRIISKYVASGYIVAVGTPASI